MDIEFQSPDGDFVYSDRAYRDMKEADAAGFQSPDGDFVYSDVRPKEKPRPGQPSFNPLTGISSILTRAVESASTSRVTVSIP